METVILILMLFGSFQMVRMHSPQKAHNGLTKISTDTATMQQVSNPMLVFWPLETQQPTDLVAWMMMVMDTQTPTQQASMVLFGLLQTARMPVILSRLTQILTGTVVLTKMEMVLPILTPQVSMARYGPLRTVRMHSLAMLRNGTIRTMMGMETILYQLLKEMHATQHSEHPIKTDLDALIQIMMATLTPTQLASMVLFGMLQMVRMRFQASQANGPIKMEMDTVTTQVALMLTIVQQTLEPLLS
jgi:hypothetical protein